jgi:hypothetical protein
VAASKQPYAITQFTLCLLSPKQAFFISLIFITGIIQMSLPCPYCQSRDTVLLESPQHFVSNSNSPSSQNNVMSPLALATLGISISKSLNIPRLQAP